MSKVIELFAVSTSSSAKNNWEQIAAKRWCPFLDRLCLKNRKSNPDILIGTCAVFHGKHALPIVICPHRLLERRQIFTDCLHLLTLHEPGNEFHVVPEITLPGGSVDYFVASVARGKVKDFVGVELQTLDSTGTVWPERQRFLDSVGVKVPARDIKRQASFGMNWKMTAKTTLVQLHHKIETFENINKKLVLVVQDFLLSYMQANFAFGHMSEPPRQGDSMHLHAYRFARTPTGDWRLELAKRLSTDAEGVGQAIGLQVTAKVELQTILTQLESKISSKTAFNVGAR
ncbi:MAG TPA: hypothetical protein VNE82_04625 [Candidatus Binataceae bacterium]|nr:hypothetical protein [Candidatus Binataceae bacterium]